MPTYNKLVRDRIPEIIERSGRGFRTEILDTRSYDQQLREKLKEEMNELLGATSRKEIVEEMADLLEVVYALGSIHDVQPDEIEQVRMRKQTERGGFSDRIFLIDVE
ncbi:nucleoside triphosphate pyrophosphohydrolase [Alkalihalophilus lindianensis]|uniref:Nucleoside triphosphate pyrophosphohydrolase n=1 Tax=Alkalihalophilus lindianensis TaxID=1630542 RepID=A0ABU3XF21_9BACI|nr:nucleoside triphosphate pyrophosphohydrolase [Alkalihalophilus lindianensis]MDV2686491.1 nucleoside triphosphate pyrophosphohydrolase [Alkalihalophilus lindianensis]